MSMGSPLEESTDGPVIKDWFDRIALRSVGPTVSLQSCLLLATHGTMSVFSNYRHVNDSLSVDSIPRGKSTTPGVC